GDAARHARGDDGQTNSELSPRTRRDDTGRADATSSRQSSPTPGGSMRVLVAGASGVVGRQLVPMLKGHGHDVTGLARTAYPSSARVIEADAFDLGAVVGAVRETRPDVIVNMLT